MRENIQGFCVIDIPQLGFPWRRDKGLLFTPTSALRLLISLSSRNIRYINTRCKRRAKWYERTLSILQRSCWQHCGMHRIVLQFMGRGTTVNINTCGVMKIRGATVKTNTEPQFILRWNNLNCDYQEKFPSRCNDYGQKWRSLVYSSFCWTQIVNPYHGLLLNYPSHI